MSKVIYNNISLQHKFYNTKDKIDNIDINNWIIYREGLEQRRR